MILSNGLRNGSKVYSNFRVWPRLRIKYWITSWILKYWINVLWLLNKFLNYFNFINCISNYFISEGDDVFLLLLQRGPLCIALSQGHLVKSLSMRGFIYIVYLIIDICKHCKAVTYWASLTIHTYVGNYWRWAAMYRSDYVKTRNIIDPFWCLSHARHKSIALNTCVTKSLLSTYASQQHCFHHRRATMHSTQARHIDVITTASLKHCSQHRLITLLSSLESRKSIALNAGDNPNIRPLRWHTMTHTDDIQLPALMPYDGPHRCLTMTQTDALQWPTKMPYDDLHMCLTMTHTDA